MFGQAIEKVKQAATEESKASNLTDFLLLQLMRCPLDAAYCRYNLLIDVLP